MAAAKSRQDLAVEAVSDAFDADVVSYFGNIRYPLDERLIFWGRNRRKRKNVLLFLQTLGGDPHAAYRIARYFQRRYKTTSAGAGNPKEGSFIAFVPADCKSAGTLLILGADRHFFMPTVELGPIDVQLRKPEEVGERTSGLTPIQAMNFLAAESGSLFEKHFKDLRFSEDLTFSTKMAAEIATTMTIGLLAPLYQQIDPIRLAEVQRQVRIISEYADRIAKSNLKTNALERLLSRYPSHDFVIDRVEVEELFEKIEEPTPELIELYYSYETWADYYEKQGQPYCFWLNEQPPEPSTPPPSKPSEEAPSTAPSSS